MRMINYASFSHMKTSEIYCKILLTNTKIKAGQILLLEGNVYNDLYALLFYFSSVA